MFTLRVLDHSSHEKQIYGLAAVLRDCVEGNASVSFMPPFSQADAEQFFGFVFDEVEQGRRILLAAFLGEELAGTVQVITAMPPNQPHRADIAKLLVKRSARGQGIAAALMKLVETVAKEAGKSLLVLDTAVGDAAERLYLRQGWTRAGVVPRYALYPDGSWCDTAIFWKQL